MLNLKCQSHFRSFGHSPSCSVERAVNNVDAHRTLSAPCLNDYEILRTLGSGSNATVYLVREKRTSYLYALKAIEYAIGGRETVWSTVQNEQAALTKLNGNDFILPLHACFHDTKNYYLVTEYLPGGDLQDLQMKRTLDAEAVRFYMAELLLAIEHTHARNIIHRDLKPENVFIDTDGHIVLGDFGSSCHDSAPRGCVGTPAFCSPEVLSGKVYGFEADLWAFGVIMYEMLAGRELFQSDTVPNDDPLWLNQLARYVIPDKPVMVETPLMTKEAFDLVNHLLTKSRNSRLSDITKIKEHCYFENIDWTDVVSRSLTPPWVPDAWASTPERRRSLKTLSRWVKRALNRPVRSA